MPRHKIDLDLLEATIASISKFGTSVESWLADTDRIVAELQIEWEGDAADAQNQAHARWVSGAAMMQEALEDLRQAARTAHSNYQGVGEVNVRMWP